MLWGKYAIKNWLTLYKSSTTDPKPLVFDKLDEPLHKVDTFTGYFVREKDCFFNISIL